MFYFKRLFKSLAVKQFSKTYNGSFLVIRDAIQIGF